MFRLLKVTGQSLQPEYSEGDFVLVSKILFFFGRPRPGSVIAFHHPTYQTLIKRVERVSSDGRDLFVLGTHRDSVDSRRFGPIGRESVIGQVLWHIKKPRP